MADVEILHAPASPRATAVYGTADQTFDFLIAMIVVCFWYQRKGLALNYVVIVIKNMIYLC